MDDLDDLLDEGSPVQQVTEKLSNITLKQKADSNPNDNWDAMDLNVQKVAAPTEDEWGDLKTEAPVVQQPKKAAAPVKKVEEEEDDWGTYETPVINKSKTSEKVQ